MADRESTQKGRHVFPTSIHSHFDREKGTTFLLKDRQHRGQTKSWAAVRGPEDEGPVLQAFSNPSGSWLSVSSLSAGTVTAPIAGSPTLARDTVSAR